jgi:hypothetical protein
VERLLVRRASAGKVFAEARLTEEDTARASTFAVACTEADSLPRLATALRTVLTSADRRELAGPTGVRTMVAAK